MIRLASLKDLQDINKLGLLIDKNFLKTYQMSEILNDQYSKIFICEEDNNIVAFLHVSQLYETVDIINIAVKVEYRHKNIASNLLRYMIAESSNTAKRFVLEVNINNVAAINLYKKFGFEIIKVRKNYYHDEDGYLMIKGEKI